MHKIFINANVEYIMGHLRYGHYEGTLHMTDDEFNQFKENPTKYINETDARYDLDLLIDDWEIDDCGDIEMPEWREVE